LRPVEVVRKELIDKINEVIINVNWIRIIEETEGINKKEWTIRINKLIELIKNNKINEIEIKWLKKFEYLIEVIEIYRPRPLPKEEMIKIIEVYIIDLNKWNWRELVKKMDEKDRTKVINEIEIILDRITRKKFNEIDFEVFKRIEIIYEKLEKLRPVEVVKKELIDKINEVIINVNWIKIIKETEGIDKNEWTIRINKLIELIKKIK